MRANFPLRLVGKVASAQDARTASGKAGTNAHCLGGRGDFLAISGGDSPLRFQVPNVTPDDLIFTLKRSARMPFAAFSHSRAPTTASPYFN
jgi:S-DNA-T family DNA segregation ATPase FtsK/SpoIIIE